MAMSEEDRESEAPRHTGFPILPVVFALAVAGSAVAALFYYAAEPATDRPPVLAAAKTTELPTRAPEDDGIQTMDGLPGFGSFDGVAFSDRAKSFAKRESAASLLARVRDVPADSRGGLHADYAAALTLKQERGEGDEAGILSAMETLSRHRDQGLRRQALLSLSRRGDAGLDAMGRSLEQLSESDANPKAQQDLIAALGELAPDAAQAIELLSNRVRHSTNSDVQQRAAETLVHMGPTAQGSLREVFKNLRTDEISRSENAEVLDRINGLLEQLEQIEGFEP